MSFIPPKESGIITNPDKVDVSVMVPNNRWEKPRPREAEQQTPCRISSGAENNAQARLQPPDSVAFVFLFPLCIPFPFPLMI